MIVCVCLSARSNSRIAGRISTKFHIRSTGKEPWVDFEFRVDIKEELNCIRVCHSILLVRRKNIIEEICLYN